MWHFWNMSVGKFDWSVLGQGKGPVCCCSLDEFSFCCFTLAVGRWLVWVWTATQQLGSFSHLEWHLLAEEPDTPAHHNQRHLDKRRCRARSETRSSGNYSVQSWWKATGWRTCHCKWGNGCPTFSLFTICTFALTSASLCPGLCVHFWWTSVSLVAKDVCGYTLALNWWDPALAWGLPTLYFLSF